MPFHGQIHGSSLPFQFAVPDATATEPGVVTLDQIRNDIVAATPSTFGNKVDTLPDGTESFVGINLVAGTEVQVDGRTVEVETTFRKMTASVGLGSYTFPPPIFRVQLYVSTNAGSTWSAVPGAMLDIRPASSNQKSVTFASPAVLPAKSLHFLGIKQTAGEDGYTNLVFSATLS